MIATRPTIPAERYGDRTGGRPRSGRRGGLRCDPGRGRCGHALPDGLSGDAAGASDDAGHPADGRRGPRWRRASRRAPARSCPPAAAGLLPVVTWDETDDPHGLVATMVRDTVASPDDGTSGSPSPTTSRRGISCASRSAWTRARFELASPLLGRLRIVKDHDEIALLTEAAHAADRVVAQIAAGRLVGRTEADVAREVRERLIAEGHDEATFAIVASGPNSASPHHEASERVIAAGEPIVLDIGGTIDGYGSDITRTLWVTGGDPAMGPDERFRHLFGVLQSRPGRSDGRGPAGCHRRVGRRRRARDPIEAEGYGEAFFHRTGHGIGLEGHEEPYIVAGNREPLRPAMAFSVEPGIYLDGAVRRADRGHRAVRAGRPDRAQRGPARAVRRRRLTRRPVRRDHASPGPVAA